MNKSDEFLAFVHAMLHKLPPGQQAQVNAQALLLAHGERVATIATSSASLSAREAQVTAARASLILELDELTNTEQPHTEHKE